jgi:hypothetical protein
MVATWSRFRVAFAVFVTSLVACLCGAQRTAAAAAWSVEQELLAADGVQGDQFGYALAAAGNTILVGAPTKTVGGNANQGAVYAIAFTGGRWVLQAELTAADGAAGDAFGSALTFVGNTALIGAVGKAFGGQELQGAVYVFTFDGTSWAQTAELAGNDGAAGDAFGVSVALTGNTALIGASNKTIASHTFQGAVYVFGFNGTSWVEQAELTTSNGATEDSFGRSLAVSGNTAIIGASTKTVAGHALQGAAYIFAFNGVTWLPHAELTASDGEANDSFGFSVAISGNMALVGCAGKDVGANFSQGAVYAFTSNGSTWTQQAELTASDGAQLDLFGTSVAFAGNTAVIGAPSKLVGATAQGGAYLFTTDGTSWTQQAELLAHDGATNDGLGGSAAILRNNEAVVGASAKTVGANSFQGAAYVFAPANALQAPSLPASAAIGLFGLLGLAGAVAASQRGRRLPNA